MTYRVRRQIAALLDMLDKADGPLHVPSGLRDGYDLDDLDDLIRLVNVASRYSRREVPLLWGMTWKGMAERPARKAVEAEGFEFIAVHGCAVNARDDRLFEIHGRRRDGLVLVLEFVANALHNATAIGFKRQTKADRRTRSEFPYVTVGMVPTRSYVLFETVTDLLATKLDKKFGPGEPLSIWPSLDADGHRISRGMPANYLLTPAEQVYLDCDLKKDLLDERMSAFPDDWKDILDFKGTRTLGEVLLAIHAATDKAGVTP